jgi:hypothetical protein
VALYAVNPFWRDGKSLDATGGCGDSFCSSLGKDH